MSHKNDNNSICADLVLAQTEEEKMSKGGKIAIAVMAALYAACIWFLVNQMLASFKMVAAFHGM